MGGESSENIIDLYENVLVLLNNEYTPIKTSI